MGLDAFRELLSIDDHNTCLRAAAHGCKKNRNGVFLRQRNTPFFLLGSIMITGMSLSCFYWFSPLSSPFPPCFSSLYWATMLQIRSEGMSRSLMELSWFRVSMI